MLFLNFFYCFCLLDSWEQKGLCGREGRGGKALREVCGRARMHRECTGKQGDYLNRFLKLFRQAKTFHPWYANLWHCFLLFKVDIIKGEAERQRLEREELEMELDAVKNQMHSVKSSATEMKRLEAVICPKACPLLKYTKISH